jgi:small redox-active disulfide protein 2
MNIKILGIGCPNCKKLEKNAREAVAKLNLEAEVEKITNPKDFSVYGIMKTPGLVIDGKVVSYGKVTTVDEIVEIIQNL